ncbi:MAG: DUF4365 domain-containing protein [Spirulinaceae cyanobacterium]
MELNYRKKEFSHAYVQAVASTAGYSFHKVARADNTEEYEILISGSTPQEKQKPPQLKIQVRPLSEETIRGEFIKYSLKQETYNQSRLENPPIPRLMVFVLVSDNLEEWVYQSETELCLRHRAYWLSLKGMPETQDSENVTIYFPRQQIFSVETLKMFMEPTK